jgi:deoxyadenosine/deoxycytidine kinase
MRLAARGEVLGGVASGKSTLAEALSGFGALSIYEEFAKNPFFQLFYADPARYSFETEITYMLQHYSSIANAEVADDQPLVADFSMALDLAYARVTLGADDLAVFETVFDHALSKIGLPDVLLKLDCPPEIELARIRTRARPAEQGITLDYLSRLNQSVEQVLLDRRFEGLDVLRIDSHMLDFRPEGRDRDAVVTRVLNALSLC